MQKISGFLSIIIAITVIVILGVIRATPNFQLQGTPMVATSNLNQYLHTTNIKQQKINEPVLKYIPTGIEIVTMEFPTSTTARLSGYIWQHYDKKDADLARTVEFESVDLAEFQKQYEIIQDNAIIIGWEFRVDILQRFYYSQYPFDAILMKLVFEYPNLSKPVMLVPALTDYSVIAPSKLPGLTSGFTLSGFVLEESLFMFEDFQAKQNLGLKEFDQPTYTSLTYKLLMQRQLLYDFIVFFLPLLIVFFLLYAVFTIQRLEEQQLLTLSIYTGLVFAVLLLHKAMRERIITGELIYIEYLFFMLYVAFMILALQILLKLFTGQKAIIVEKIFDIYRVFFWPLQLSIILMVTLIVFYY